MIENVLAEFQTIKIQVDGIENRIRELFEAMIRREKITFERPKDHGARCISFIVYFDDLNVDAFNEQKMANLRGLIGQFEELRRKQAKLENEIDIQAKLVQQNRFVSI